MKSMCLRLDSDKDDLEFGDLEQLVKDAKALGATASTRVKARIYEIEVVIEAVS